MNKTLLSALALAPACAYSADGSTAERAPNIVLIMCDDMGFSDLGCYGGEVQTPNIDRLAEQGCRFSQFKNTGRSCPSRASLMTGYYAHETGLGWMTAVDEHRPGYRGQIAANIPTLAEVMKQNGYATYMTGKWHLTVDGAFGKPNGSYPVQRGFDRHYGSLTGGSSYYTPVYVYDGLEPVNKFPDDYYYTTALTDSAVSFIRHHEAARPMFLYVAHYAPHIPLQAPQDRVNKCLPRYQVGYDVLRQQRFERQKELGLFPDTLELPIYDKEFSGNRPAWEELTAEQRTKWTNDMATYAAMIEIVDDGIGEIVNALSEKGMLENTVFILLSDNGATDEAGFIGRLMADLSNTPYRNYKQKCFNGGTSSPLIITYGDPAKNKLAGKWTAQQAHIIDILPTCVDLADGTYPTTYKEGKALPGESLIPAIDGAEPHDRELYFEHQGSCAVIEGDWKLVRGTKDEDWQLVDLVNDPFEQEHALSRTTAKLMTTLRTDWQKWASTHNVMPLEDKPWGTRINYYKSLYPDQDGIDDVPTGISQIEDGTGALPLTRDELRKMAQEHVSVYDLLGKRVNDISATPDGIYIVKTASSAAYKVHLSD